MGWYRRRQMPRRSHGLPSKPRRNESPRCYTNRRHRITDRNIHDLQFLRNIEFRSTLTKRVMGIASHQIRLTGPSRVTLLVGDTRQIRAIPTPRMASGRDGRPHVRLSPDSRSNNGHCWRLLSRQSWTHVLQCIRPVRSITLHFRSDRLDRRVHNLHGSYTSTGVEGTEETPRLLHYFTDRIHDARHRSRRISFRLCHRAHCRTIPPHDSRHLQSCRLPSRWRDSTHSRFTFHERYGRSAQTNENHIRIDGNSTPSPLRRPSTQRVLE